MILLKKSEIVAKADKSFLGVDFIIQKLQRVVAVNGQLQGAADQS